MPAQRITTRRHSCSSSSLPQNPSSQELVNRNYYGKNDRPLSINLNSRITTSQWISIWILFFVNLINYMDRLTIAGILTQIQIEYDIGNSESGALQTAFVISYMIFAPLFGYLGDRYSRKLIMASGVFLWAIFTLIGSFMPNYTTFLLCRAMVGIGEASYSTIAPTLISDMFVKDVRSKMLAFFYFAIPVGSGLGYIIGSETMNLAGGDWRWGLRVTPFLGLGAVTLILCCMTDPPRGQSEGHNSLLSSTTYKDDLLSLMNNKSFMFSSLAFTCVTFATGALSWWGPNFIKIGIQSLNLPRTETPIDIDNVPLIFGAVTMGAGIIGVPLGSFLSTKFKAQYPRVDPVLCGIGLMVSALLLGLGMMTVRYNIHLTFILLFLGEVSLNLNWSIVADMLLYVVIPTRRSTAEAIQILMSHTFGDAGSPYLIGLISDSLGVSFRSSSYNCDSSTHISSTPSLSLNNRTNCEDIIDFKSLQYSLLSNCVVEIFGGFLFLVTAIFIVSDKMKCDKTLRVSVEEMSYSEDDDMPQLKPLFSPKFSSIIKS